jgi:hypothetical protein
MSNPDGTSTDEDYDLSVLTGLESAREYYQANGSHVNLLRSEAAIDSETSPLGDTQFPLT